MNIKKVYAVYFSPAGSTKRIAEVMARAFAEALNVPAQLCSYTYPAERERHFAFGPEDLVLWCTPVYAGRIPNKTLDYVSEAFEGDGTPMIPAAIYGNRNFDQTLTELSRIMQKKNAVPVAAAAIPVRHVFSDSLAAGKPDDMELSKIREFCRETAKTLQRAEKPKAVQMPGDGEELRYYVPKKTDGTPAKFLKAKPVLDVQRCSGCGICAQHCPMGSIDLEAGRPVFARICIKCQACRRACPQGALYFDDPDFLSHIAMLEENFQEPREPLFLYADR